MDTSKETVDAFALTQMLPSDLLRGTYSVKELSYNISALFWNSNFWLPRGYTWNDLEPTSTRSYRNFNDILTYPLIIGSVICFVRFFILNPYVFGPFAKNAGLKYRTRKPTVQNPVLERLFLQTRRGKVHTKQVECAAHHLKQTTRQVERWLRQRAKETKLNKLQKFQESAFIAAYHMCISVYGFSVMYDKAWLRDISHAWKGYPTHEISSGEWWYYIVSVSFYCAFCFSHLRGGAREYLHHLSALLLLTFSWACNLIRVGSLVLLVHECGDIILQVAKMCQYLQKRRATEILFGVFFVVWIVTRLGLFPFWIIRSVLFEAPKHAFMPAAYVFYALLLVLLLLNLFWTFIIVTIILKSIFKGEVVNDIRSSASNDTSDEPSKIE